MNHVERLAQIVSMNHKRDVCLAGALCAGNYADAAATQSTEQLASYTWSMLHVLTHNRHCSQTAFNVHREHGPLFDLLGKLIIKNLYGSSGILVTHTDRSRVFR